MNTTQLKLMIFQGGWKVIRQLITNRIGYSLLGSRTLNREEGEKGVEEYRVGEELSYHPQCYFWLH